MLIMGEWKTICKDQRQGGSQYFPETVSRQAWLQDQEWILVLLLLLVLFSIFILLCFYVHHFTYCPVLPSPCQHCIVDPSSPKAFDSACCGDSFHGNMPSTLYQESIENWENQDSLYRNVFLAKFAGLQICLWKLISQSFKFQLIRSDKGKGMLAEWPNVQKRILISVEREYSMTSARQGSSISELLRKCYVAECSKSISPLTSKQSSQSLSGIFIENESILLFQNEFLTHLTYFTAFKEEH